jgi:hypothetical protein
MPKTKVITVCSALGLLLVPIARADFTAGMIARWTFNAPGEAALLDDSGKLKFETGLVAAAPKPEATGGVLSIPPEVFLHVGGLSEAAFPQLKQTATVFVRLKLTPNAQNTTFLFGLTAGAKPADWSQLRLAAITRASSTPPSIGVHANLAEGEIGMAAASLPVEADKFVNVAITFDADLDAAVVYVDGQKIERRKAAGGKPLAGFTHFVLGRLSAAAGTAMTVDEVRIYDTVVPADWIGEITPVDNAK